jgi:hypothetical protein
LLENIHPQFRPIPKVNKHIIKLEPLVIKYTTRIVIRDFFTRPLLVQKKAWEPLHPEMSFFPFGKERIV